MAIQWNLFPEAFNQQQERINEQYDFSYITPELVRGFSRYQALRPEQEVREARAVEEAKKGIEDEIKRRREQQWRTKWEADRAAEELQKDLDSGDMYDARGLIDSASSSSSPGKEKGARKFTVPEGVRTRTGNFWKDTNVKVDPGLVETELLPPDDPGMTDEERAELETEILKERLGDNYDSYMRSYGIYGGLNPYEQMIQAGKRSSYWDPEIGKIYTDAGEKIRKDSLDAAKLDYEIASSERDKAWERYKSDPFHRYSNRVKAEQWDAVAENALSGLKSAREGKYYEGQTAQEEKYGNESALVKMENRIANNEFAKDSQSFETALDEMVKNGQLNGEEALYLRDYRKMVEDQRRGLVSKEQLDALTTLSALRPGAVQKLSDAQERVPVIDAYMAKITSGKMNEGTWRDLVNQMEEWHRSVEKDLPTDKQESFERLRRNFVNARGLGTLESASKLFIMGMMNNLGLLPEGTGKITSSQAQMNAITNGLSSYRDNLETQYNANRDLAISALGSNGWDPYTLQNMDLFKGLNPLQANTPSETFPKAPEDIGIGAAADNKGNFTITLPNGQTDSWTVDMKKTYPEFFKFFNGETSKVRFKKGTTNVLTDGHWEYNIDTRELIES